MRQWNLQVQTKGLLELKIPISTKDKAPLKWYYALMNHLVSNRMSKVKNSVIYEAS